MKGSIVARNHAAAAARVRLMGLALIKGCGPVCEVVGIWSKSIGFVEESYSRHAGHFELDLVEPDRARIVNSWFDENTADYWRHARAYECADCVAADGPATWLTIGDGSWGLDAIRLEKRGVVNVLPTDISETLLKEAKDRGLIKEYQIENAERLSFADRSFDYVFCKESLHHMPRPYLAIYEMLRVARKGIFVVEPNEPAGNSVPVTKRSLLALASGITRAVMRRLSGQQAWITLGGGSNSRTPEWEESGNYIYAVSRFELQRLALALNLPGIAIKGFNDHYVVGCEFEPADESKSSVFGSMLHTIADMDDQCRAGARDYNMLMAGIFVSRPGEAVKKALLDRGWEYVDLPRNPYIPS